MNYTKEEIERYLEILRSYNITSGASTNQAVGEENRKVRCWNCQSDCFLLNQVIKFVIPVEQLMAMFWGIMIIKIMIDYIFERRVFIRESVIMRKRLMKFLKD